VTGHALPADDEVRATADELLTEHREGGAYPSVSALAKGFNVNRSTFYRHYSAITNAMLDSAAQQHADGPKRRLPRHTDGDRDETIRRLRTENNDLRRHLEIYEEHIRMLTIDNTNQKSQLDRLAGVTDLNARRNP
jgi:AcrR family transcriptional regulator